MKGTVPNVCVRVCVCICACARVRVGVCEYCTQKTHIFPKTWGGGMLQFGQREEAVNIFCWKNARVSVNCLSGLSCVWSNG